MKCLSDGFLTSKVGARICTNDGALESEGVDENRLQAVPSTFCRNLPSFQYTDLRPVRLLRLS